MTEQHTLPSFFFLSKEGKKLHRSQSASLCKIVDLTTTRLCIDITRQDRTRITTTMAKQGTVIDMSDVPRQIIKLPDPPSDCDSALMSDGSITASFCMDSIIYGGTDHDRGDVEEQQQDLQQQQQQQHRHEQLLAEQQAQQRISAAPSPTPAALDSKKSVRIKEPEILFIDDDTDPTTSIVDSYGNKIEYAKTMKEEKKTKCLRTASLYLFGVAVTIVIVALGVNLLVYFDKQNNVQSTDATTTSSSNNNGTSSNVFDQPTTSPPLANTTSGSVSGGNTVSTQPVVAPSSASPSAAPTTLSDVITTIVIEQLRQTLPSNPLAPINRAVEWLIQEAELAKNTEAVGGQVYGDLEKFAQRLSLLTVRFALLGNGTSSSSSASRNANTDSRIPPPIIGVDECQWYDNITNITITGTPIICNDLGLITHMDFSDRNLTGTIASEIRLLPSLLHLDLSNNALQSSIPETLYDLRNLERLYLYKNRLTGTLSQWIGQWDSIKYLHLSHNQLMGQIPHQMQSDEEGIRPLKYLNLYDNQFSGTIPENLRLRDLEYFDVGRNNLRGTLPEDVGDDFVVLRHFFLDHNRFEGTIPETYPLAGSGRMISFFADHNQLTGSVPDNWSMFNKLVQYTVHENNFHTLGPLNCNFNVFAGGQLVELKADCNICTCQDIFCDEMCSVNGGF
jgi:hypothetical protein